MSEFVQFLNIPRLRIPGKEADDVIASYTAAAVRQNHVVRIVSVDKDFGQLVKDDSVAVYKWTTGGLVTEKQVRRQFWVKPEFVAEVQAMVGDEADNIPGIRGIGLLTASRIVREFGSMENLIQNVESVTPGPRFVVNCCCIHIAMLLCRL
jgi:DNA polymerase I